MTSFLASKDIAVGRSLVALCVAVGVGASHGCIDMDSPTSMAEGRTSAEIDMLCDGLYDAFGSTHSFPSAINQVTVAFGGQGMDGWGHEYLYSNVGNSSVRLRSLGKDIFDEKDDIVCLIDVDKKNALLRKRTVNVFGRKHGAEVVKPLG